MERRNGLQHKRDGCVGWVFGDWFGSGRAGGVAGSEGHYRPNLRELYEFSETDSRFTHTFAGRANREPAVCCVESKKSSGVLVLLGINGA
jgi:hypothetical protein